LTASINNAGQIVGEAQFPSRAVHAFAYSGASFQDLGTLGGAGSRALDNNASGQIVGFADLANGNTDAFIWTSASGMVDLGTLGGTFSIGYGINNLGVVVGSSYLSGNATEDAFIYSNGKMVDLNSLVPSGSGWLLDTATSINDRGQIAGVGYIGGQRHAFVLTTNTPELQTIISATAGLLLFAGIRGKNARRRGRRSK
jgi:probable HAF family extracellular repeat protein